MEGLVVGAFLVLVLFITLLYCVKIRITMKCVENDFKYDQFVRLQKTFYTVYLLAVLGDWLQGPYIYKLYQNYGLAESQISALYVTGFVSSATLGTLAGPISDQIGRKVVALAYCFIYTICCAIMLCKNFLYLMIGRLMGGVATSILFSTFESWYVSEHCHTHLFPSEWMSSTFTYVTFFNGLMAILAGLVSYTIAEYFNLGPIAPFILAIGPLMMAAFLILRTWPENYGEFHKENIILSCINGMLLIFKNRDILTLCGIQSAVESIMYIFVFLWTPILLPASPPLGMVFASFMTALMTGSLICEKLVVLTYRLDWPTLVLIVSMTAAMFSLVILYFCIESTSIAFCCFLLLEVSFGMYFPCMSTLKGILIPESHRATVMNWFRVPLNFITCCTLIFVNSDKSSTFGGCSCLMAFGILLVILLHRRMFYSDAKHDSTEIVHQNIVI